MEFKIILNIISNGSLWPIDRTLIGNIIPGQSGHGSNGKEGVTPHSPEF